MEPGSSAPDLQKAGLGGNAGKTDGSCEEPGADRQIARIHQPQAADGAGVAAFGEYRDFASARRLRPAGRSPKKTWRPGCRNAAVGCSIPTSSDLHAALVSSARVHTLLLLSNRWG